MELHVNIDCSSLERMVDFYTQALGYELYGTAGEHYSSIMPPEGGDGPKLVFQKVPEAKVAKNRMHLDLIVDDIEAEARRFVDLGATRISQQPITEYGITWIVMHDPEGNEICLCDG
jgi:predicted enzyme related to lactoylglutathione lyase